MPPLDPEDFLGFAFPGQPSVPHLAEFIHARALAAIQKRSEELQDIFPQANDSRQKEIQSLIDQMDRFSVKQILDTWLDPEMHPDIFQSTGAVDDPGMPDRLKLTHTSSDTIRPAAVRLPHHPQTGTSGTRRCARDPV